MPVNLANPSDTFTSRVPESPAALPLAFDSPAIRKTTARNKVMIVLAVSIGSEVTTPVILGLFDLR
jgi:hypothetical protein